MENDSRCHPEEPGGLTAWGVVIIAATIFSSIALKGASKNSFLGRYPCKIKAL